MSRRKPRRVRTSAPAGHESAKTKRMTAGAVQIGYKYRIAGPRARVTSTHHQLSCPALSGGECTE